MIVVFQLQFNSDVYFLVLFYYLGEEIGIYLFFNLVLDIDFKEIWLFGFILNVLSFFFLCFRCQGRKFSQIQSYICGKQDSQSDGQVRKSQQYIARLEYI